MSLGCGRPSRNRADQFRPPVDVCLRARATGAEVVVVVLVVLCFVRDSATFLKSGSPNSIISGSEFDSENIKSPSARDPSNLLMSCDRTPRDNVRRDPPERKLDLVSAAMVAGDALIMAASMLVLFNS